MMMPRTPPREWLPNEEVEPYTQESPTPSRSPSPVRSLSPTLSSPDLLPSPTWDRPTLARDHPDLPPELQESVQHLCNLFRSPLGPNQMYFVTLAASSPPPVEVTLPPRWRGSVTTTADTTWIPFLEERENTFDQPRREFLMGTRSVTWPVPRAEVSQLLAHMVTYATSIIRQACFRARIDEIAQIRDMSTSPMATRMLSRSKTWVIWWDSDMTFSPTVNHTPWTPRPRRATYSPDPEDDPEQGAL